MLGKTHSDPTGPIYPRLFFETAGNPFLSLTFSVCVHIRVYIVLPYYGLPSQQQQHRAGGIYIYIYLLDDGGFATIYFFYSR